ncbi:hypothetical protein J1N35_008156 [Gossypium stocksii]|uniref:Uncharacterized protein n=1 Tax=Gossypium stocksii TaxID=47602 RepID=A0A9D4AG80_9ROSI|nr:hypothetical protein J1N35_008156 [Gossypium stocksii]
MSLMMMIVKNMKKTMTTFLWSSQTLHRLLPPLNRLLSNEVSVIILGTITSLIKEFRGFSTRVDNAFEHVNNNVSGLDSRMSRVVENIVFLMSQFPHPPPPQDD